MAYLGVQPLKGQNRTIDNISASFNGANVTFNLTSGGFALTPATAYQLFISVGGVLQNPGVDFTVSGNQITFTTAPTLGLTFWGLYQGDAIDSVSISDGSITTAKLATGLTVTLDAGTVSAPSLTFAGDTNTGLFSPGADTWGVTTGGTERLRITSAGLVGIGTSSPDTVLHTYGGFPTATIERNAGTGAAASLGLTNSTNSGFLVTGSDTTFTITASTAVTSGTGLTERLRIDSSGRLLVGTSTARSPFSNNPLLQVENVGANNAVVGSFTFNAGNTNGPNVSFIKSRGTTLNSNTVVQSGDILGEIYFAGTDGTKAVSGAAVTAFVDGTPGADDMPGRLVFATTADGASSPTERMRIANTGKLDAYSTGADTFIAHSSNAAGTTDYLIRGAHSASGTADGTISFQIFTNGNTQNTNNSYAGISDIRLKENIVDATSQWSDIKALQVRKYNFKEGQTHTQIGLIAQEVELVSPGLVSETPDRDAEGNDLGTVTKSVNYSVLYMKAVKALQEAMERIETLESEMAAVKAQLA